MPKRRKLTHAPSSTPNPPGDQESSARSRTQSRSRSQSQSRSQSPPAKTRSPSAASRAVVSPPHARIPPGLFSDRVTVVHAGRYTFWKKNPPRFFLFERRSGKATTTATKSLLHRRPPSHPVTPMLNYVQILTTPTADTPGTCLLVHHDNRRYLFGHVAEGTQRAFVQQKVSLSRAEEVFLTGPVGWHTAGGLIGMILTVAEVVTAARLASEAEAKAKAARVKEGSGGKNKSQGNNAKASKGQDAAAAAATATARELSIHGGQNLTQLLATARRFVFRKGLPIRPHEIRRDHPSATATAAATAPAAEGGAVREPDWVDDNMMVWYVPVFAEDAEPVAASNKRRREGGDENTEGNTEEADRQFLDSVVTHMFDSDWKLDALVETTLHEAKLPAKLFVRDASGHLQEYTGPMPGDEKEGVNVPDIPVLVRRPWPGALIQGLPHTAPSRQSLCYIVRNHARRGKVNPAAVARLGVAKLDIRKLVAGESVTAADGSTVTPEMVIGASVEGAGFAVVDLPDRSYVAGFLARPEWADARVTGAINTMFWLLGPGVAADARVQAFMAEHAAMRHCVAAPDTCANRLALSSAAALQVKHHRVDPDRFPLQQYDNVAPAEDASSSLPYEAARPGWTVRLAPQVVEEDQKVFPFVDFKSAVGQMDSQVLKLADTARASLQVVAAAAAPPPPPPQKHDLLPPAHADIEVIPLGTGSAMPSKYRNVSATLVRVPGRGSYLFDCGENTLGSMRRLLGAQALAEVLRDLRCVWISHLHADHHLGTASVLRAWRDATAGSSSSSSSGSSGSSSPRLMVASHVNMLHWLREYAEIEDFGLERLRLVSLECPEFPRTRVCTPYKFGGAEAAEFGLRRIDAARVDHCHGALAVAFTFAGDGQPLKIAYSGDCRPSANFVAVGRGATLLIHESTFDDELAGEAVAKKHSTMGEALDVGRRMGAARVLLTHFSQRYPKIPVFGDGDPAGGDMQVLVAFDQMRVRLGDFRTAAAFLPALQKLYEGEEK